MKTMAAGVFKAKCLKVPDDVQGRRETVIVTKNGKPVAKVVPLDLEGDDPLAVYRFPGKITIVGDIEGPMYTDEELDDFERRSVEKLPGHP